MNPRELLESILKKLMDKGADKASLKYSAETDEEFNIVFKELNLLRTVETNSVSIAVIKDQKQASAKLNQFDEASIDLVLAEVMESVENSNPDPAFDISPKDEGSWTQGDLEPDADKVVFRLQEFISQTRERFPDIHFDATLTHEKSHEIYLNSNGASFEDRSGTYGFNTVFTAKKGNKMSSMNFTGFLMGDLDRELLKINFTGDLMRQSSEQIETRPIPENFTGEVVIAPFLAMQLVYTFIQGQLADGGLLTKSSKFPDHLGQRILHTNLTLLNDHTHPDLCQRAHFTSDGFKSVSAPVIENGVLKNYPISLYAANKLGKKRTMGPVANLILPPGEEPLADIIGSVKQCILCMRASFGDPNANGDFSGVIKNSYYIEDGRISHPISETMLNGNIIDMLNSVGAISSESFNTGRLIFPYLKIGDVYISRK